MPLQFQYNNSITIHAVAGQHITAFAPLASVKLEKAFVEGVKSALKKLAKLRSGAELINAIAASNHQCTIFQASMKNATECYDNCAQADPNGTGSEVDCSIVSFRPRHRNLPIMGTAIKKVQRQPAVGGNKGAPEVQYKTALGVVGGTALQTKAQAAGELDLVLARAGNGDLARGRALASMLTGISINDLTDMAQGTRIITDNQYYKLCFFFYDSLTPGPGVNTCVRLSPILKLDAPDGTYKPKKDYTAVPPEIVIGHELVHAWRMMAGRRVVREGWEEEAMTTGIGMFRPWRFTENRLRSEAGYPTRPTYSNGKISSYFGNNLKMSTENQPAIVGADTY
jgi:hypothetical protein